MADLPRKIGMAMVTLIMVYDDYDNDHDNEEEEER